MRVCLNISEPGCLSAKCTCERDECLYNKWPAWIYYKCLGGDVVGKSICRDVTIYVCASVCACACVCVCVCVCGE